MIRYRTSWRALGALLGGLAIAGALRAEPYLPTSDQEVLERLPASGREELRALAERRAQLAANPADLELALSLATAYAPSSAAARVTRAMTATRRPRWRPGGIAPSRRCRRACCARPCSSAGTRSPRRWPRSTPCCGEHPPTRRPGSPARWCSRHRGGR